MQENARGSGPLFIIGGHEDRDGAMPVLERFLELCGGPGSTIVVLTAASNVPDKVWAPYEEAFAALGAAYCRPIHVDNRAQAEDAGLAQAVAGADGIFISGGDQKKLLASIGGTAIEAAIHAARVARGAW